MTMLHGCDTRYAGSIMLPIGILGSIRGKKLH
jgi:hypothetical protein